MNVNINKFKSPIDKSNPLSFFTKVLKPKYYDTFIESVYPKYGLNFTKLKNGGYSFYINTGLLNGEDDIDYSIDEYKGSILNDLTEIFRYYIAEIQILLETRKRNHLYESKKIDTKYIELLIVEIDSLTSNLNFIINPSEKSIILDSLREARRLIDSYLSDNHITPVKQKHIEYEPQHSYLLGETNHKEIEKIYNLLENHALLDTERNCLDTLK